MIFRGMRIDYHMVQRRSSTGLRIPLTVVGMLPSQMDRTSPVTLPDVSTVVGHAKKTVSCITACLLQLQIGSIQGSVLYNHDYHSMVAMPP